MYNVGFVSITLIYPPIAGQLAGVYEKCKDYIIACQESFVIYDAKNVQQLHRGSRFLKTF